MGNDSCFEGGRARVVNDQRASSILRTELKEHAANTVSRRIRTGYTHNGRTSTERDQIRKNVRGSAEMNRLSPNFNYGNRGFGRDACDVSPDELVKHDVAEYDYVSGAK
jgi:hypothetical protein